MTVIEVTETDFPVHTVFNDRRYSTDWRQMPCVSTTIAHTLAVTFTRGLQPREDDYFEHREKDFRGDSVQRCCSHVHSVRVRTPCLTFTGTQKKSVSNCMKVGEVLKSTHIHVWSVEQSQQNCVAVAIMVFFVNLKWLSFFFCLA